jgi:hypothetical protein
MSGETTDDLSVDVAAQAAFNEGYAGIEAPTTTPEPAEQPVSKEAEPQQSPKPFSVSEDQWRNVEQQMARLASLDDFKRQIDSVAGNVGGLKQIVEQLRQKGASKIEKAQLKKLSDQYPELAEAFAEDLSAILSAPAGINPEEIDQRISTALAKEREHRSKEWLEDNYPDWVETVRLPEFQAYQLTLTPDENKALSQSVDGRLVGKHVKAFKELKAKADALKTATPPAPPAQRPPTAPTRPAPTTASRSKVLEAAVPARGTGGGPSAPDPADAFNAGYALKGRA